MEHSAAAPIPATAFRTSFQQERQARAKTFRSFFSPSTWPMRDRAPTPHRSRCGTVSAGRGRTEAGACCRKERVIDCRHPTLGHTAFWHFLDRLSREILNETYSQTLTVGDG